MKKVILSAAALMIGAIGFAQVSGAPTAQSQDPAVVPSNSASDSDNKGKSVQEGNDQRVRVRQAGTLQSVYTYQINAEGTGGNRAEVLQSGSILTDGVDDSGKENAADVIQHGTNNSSFTSQQGNFNNAITNQGTAAGLSAGNMAYISQGNGGKAESNFGAIDQDGDNNQGKVIQRYDNNDAYMDQDGDNLRGRVEQIASPNGSEGHWGYVRQTGEDNESWMLQEGAGARNYAATVQGGTGNYADQYQNATSSAGDANIAGIVQGKNPTDDFDHVVDMNKDGALAKTFALGTALEGVDSFYSSFVTGSLNSVGAEAFQDQSGDNNLVLIGQVGEAGNYAEQDQSGDENTGLILQRSESTGLGNLAEQDQTGNGNTAGIVQIGRNQKASQLQNGANNDALFTQFGVRNEGFSFQYGAENWVSIAQNGTENLAIITQHGGQSYISEQGLIDGGAANNQVDVIQMGPAGSIDGVNFKPAMDREAQQSWLPTPGAYTPDVN